MKSQETIKVLLADDKKDSIATLKRCLEQVERIEICAVANNGGEALDKIYEFTPDIVLLDVVMPGFDGISVLRRLKNKPANKNVKVIMITAANDNYILKEAFALGAQYYLIKPINPEVLCETVLMVYEMNKNKFANNKSKGRALCSSKDTSMIIKLLSELEVPTHLLGYAYIIDALSLIINESCSRMPYNQICDCIALHNNTTRECVETAIKGAIKKTALNNSSKYKKIFNKLSGDVSAPSSLRFITKLNEELQLLKNQID